MKREEIEYDYSIKSYLPVFNGFRNTEFSLPEEEVIRNHNRWLEPPIERERFAFDKLNYEKRVANRATEFVENELEYWFGLENDALEFEADFSSVEYSPDYNRFNDKVMVDYKFQQTIFDWIRVFVEENYDAFTEFLKKFYNEQKDYWKIVDTEFDFLQDWDKHYEDKLKVTEYGLGLVLDFLLKEKDYSVDDLHRQLIVTVGEVDYEII